MTEERLRERIDDYDFHKLVKVAKYMYTANLGSNDFQIDLEKRLNDSQPKAENIAPSDLIELLRSTSKYVFRYNSKALYHKLESAAMRLMPFLTHK